MWPSTFNSTGTITRCYWDRRIRQGVSPTTGRIWQFKLKGIHGGTPNSKEVDGVLVVGFGSSKLLDESVIRQVGKELVEITSQTGDDKKILLSFHRVNYMSSAMLGRLVMFLKKCQQQDIQLKVCSISDEIMEVFKITKLNKMFDIYKNEQKAGRRLQQKGVVRLVFWSRLAAGRVVL